MERGFPGIAGIDGSLVQLTVGDDADLYRDLMQRFAARSAGVAQAVADDVAAGRHEGAAKRLHDFRGVAATLGATDTAAAARVLEAAIRSDEPSFAVPLQAFRDNLDALMRAAAPWLAETVADAPSSAASGPLANDRLQSTLAQLGDALRARRFAARGLAADIARSLAGTPLAARFAPVAEDTAALRFAAAEAALAAFIAQGGHAP